MIFIHLREMRVNVEAIRWYHPDDQGMAVIHFKEPGSALLRTDTPVKELDLTIHYAAQEAARRDATGAKE